MLTFSDLAEAGLSKATKSDDEKAALRHALTLHLSHPDASDKSRQLPVPERCIYMYAIWKVRVTWEQMDDGDIKVWSVHLLKSHRS